MRSLAPIGRWLVAGCLAAGAMTAGAQFPSATVGFNGPPIDDPPTSQEMFQAPDLSPTTDQYIIPNESGFDQNAAFRASGLQTEGAAALQVFFDWDDPAAADPDAWVRLTTFNGNDFPNPALHLDGKVRFNLNNLGDFFDGEIGLVLGVRETGNEVAQLGDGGTSGPIEWVGVDPTPNGIIAGPDGIVDTAAVGDDIQAYNVGANIADLELPPGTAVIEVGDNGVLDTVPTNDDEVRSGYFIAANGTRTPIAAVTLPPSAFAYAIEFDLVTGDVTVDGSTVDGGIAGFTGDGVLGATPANRGTLEHLAIINVVDDPSTFINFAVDELEFEAPVPDPVSPPRVLGPVFATDTAVDVATLVDASSASLYLNDVLIGSATPDEGIATIGGLSLAIGDVLTATQTANGITSDFSPPVTVFAAGTALADDFDSYLNQDQLEAVWTPTDPNNTRGVALASGSAASCPNYLIEAVPAGPAASQLYFDLGAVNGTDAEPLVLTYRFRHDNNNGNARGRLVLSPALGDGVLGAVGFAFSNDASYPASLREQYTSFLNSPSDAVPAGYFTNYFGNDLAATGIAREAGVWQEMQVVVTTDVVNFYINGVLANPVDPDTQVELFPAGVPRGSTDDFRFVTVGVGFSNNGTEFLYDNLSVTLGGAPIPFGPPVAVDSPTVTNEPILPGSTEVSVTDIDPAATEVAVLVDGFEVDAVANPATDPVTLTVPILGGGQAITATQTVGGVESCPSRAVLTSVPAPTVAPLLAPGQVIVEVNDVLAGVAEEVTVYRDLGGGELVFLGSVADPAAANVDVDVPALVAEELIVATQTVAGVESPASEPILVRDPGIMGPWIETSPLPIASTGHRLVYDNGFVYCIGGRTNESDATTYAADNVWYAPVNEDGSLGAWVETTSLPQPTASHGAAVVDGRIYVWGGWTAFYPTVNVCYYADPNPDGSINEWITSPVTIPSGPGGTQMDSFGNGLLTIDDHLYIIAGEANDGSLNDTVYVSTLTQDGDYGPWVETTPTPVPAGRSGSWFHGSALIRGTTEDYIYRVGANFGATYEVDTIRATVNPDGTVGEWTEVDADLPEGRYEFANNVVDNKWIVITAGMIGSSLRDNTFYAAVNPDDGSISEWVEGLPYPILVARNAGISYKAGGKYYFLVVSGGPFPRTGQRDPRVHYARIGRYFDTASFAEFQQCFAPGVPPTSDCERNTDLNNDGEVDFDDVPELEEYWIGPEE